jgi:hypothetical protein
LTVAAAFYEPSALLRAGWPLHRRLRVLGAHAAQRRSAALPDTATDACEIRAPADAAPAACTPTTNRMQAELRIVTVGEQRLPEPCAFTASRQLLSLPFVLEGRPECTREAARLLDRNRMRAYTPRARNPAFDFPAMPAFDAVGYLSLRSLSAELGARYYAEGLGEAWMLIERVLRDPDGEHLAGPRPADSAGVAAGAAPRLHYAQRRVRIEGGEEAARERYRRLFAAHGLRVAG